MPIRLLFVCAGNICRSPMAEALFRHLVEGHPRLQDVEVGSAGTIAYRGNAPSVDAVEVMQEEFGLDISSHRARLLEAHAEVDLLLALDRSTFEDAVALGVKGRVEMLGNFAGTDEEVDDPYGGPRPGYVRAAHQIKRLLEAVINRLEEGD